MMSERREICWIDGGYASTISGALMSTILFPPGTNQ